MYLSRSLRHWAIGRICHCSEFCQPAQFLGLDDGGWERLKQRAQWDRLNVSEARALRLLNFIAFDFPILPKQRSKPLPRMVG